MWTTDDSDTTDKHWITDVSPANPKVGDVVALTVRGGATISEAELAGLNLWLYWEGQPVLKPSFEVTSYEQQKYTLTASVDLRGWSAGASLRVALGSGGEGSGWQPLVLEA